MAAIAATALVATTAACGGDDPAPAPQEESSAAAAAGYLEVPVGVTLTEPGSALGLGETATVAWEPREDTTAVLDITVDRIERTTFDESFQGWQIDAATAAMTPYFVRATATNVSESDLGGVPVLIWGQDDSGTLIDTQRFKRKTFEPCPSGDLPKKFVPGAEAEVCFVYLIAAGRSLDAVAFPPPAGLEPVLWSGEVSTKVKVPKPEKKSGGKAGKGGKSDKGEPSDEASDEASEAGQ